MRFPRDAWPVGLVLAGVLSSGCAGPMPSSRSGRPAPTPVAPPAAIPSTTPGPQLGVPEAREDDPFLLAMDVPEPRKLSPGIRAVADQKPLTGPTWESKFRSVRGRPIEATQLGEGSRRVAILASLHGNETQSFYLVSELARYLNNQPETISGQTVLLIRTPNPDGLQARSIFNANGVDLNRNFPSNNWKALGKNRSGPRVGSEPETRAVVQLLEEFRPELLIHVKDNREGSLVNAEGSVRDKAESIARSHQWKDVHDLGQVTSGSVEHYANTRLKCPCLTLLTHREAKPEVAWERNQPVLLSALDDLVTAPVESTTSRRRGGTEASSSRPVLPDDEDVLTPRTRSEFGSGPVPEKGYLELPPPPGR